MSTRIKGLITAWGWPSGATAAVKLFETNAAYIDTGSNKILEAGAITSEAAVGELKVGGVIVGKSYSEFQRKVNMTLVLTGATLAAVKAMATPPEAGDFFTIAGSDYPAFDGTWDVEPGATLQLGTTPQEFAKVTVPLSQVKNDAGTYTSLEAVT